MRYMDQLGRMRQELDEIDATLVDLLVRRLEICRRIAAHKRSHGIPMMQTGRISAVKRPVALQAGTRGLREEFVLEVYDRIIAEACKLEDEIIGGTIRSPEP